jgi:hypothetical protein
VKVVTQKGAFSAKVPAVPWEISIQSAQMRPVRKELELSADEPAHALGTFDLEKRIDRVALGERAPPMTYEHGDPVLDARLEADHLPRSWTLCYFWGKH